MFWNIHELKQLHIELTNACNAACPMCVRFHHNSPLIRPDLEIGQITLDKFKTYFPPDIIQRCNLILFCGVHGDPGVARDVFEICEYIDNVSPKTAVRINTNGGMRRAEWWAKMGDLFSKHTKNHSKDGHWSITFSIDGLENTNHLYRRNVNWKILMENVTAFINAGGLAVWDFLIFKHNEHQIADAFALSKEMKFDEFIPKKALGVDDGTNLTIMPALNKEGTLEYSIEAPIDPKNRNLENPQGIEPIRFYPFKSEDYRTAKSVKGKSDFYEKSVNEVYDLMKDNNYAKEDSCSIKCKSNRGGGRKEIFVDNFGRVMPCCYIGTHLNGVYTDIASLQLHNAVRNYGWEHFNLNNYTLTEILSKGHLDNVYADSWSKDSVKNGKLKYCADTCGQVSGIDKIFTQELNNKSARM